MKQFFFFMMLALFGLQGMAQSLLSKRITVEASRQRLADVLEIISNQGNFYFSYNSNIVKRDSLVSIAARNQSVQQILEGLFSPQFEFRESGHYIIIKRKPIQLTITTTTQQAEKYYNVVGYINDSDNGAKVPDASVYEKEQLASSLTNADGFFKLKLKSRFSQAELTVSKEFYYDTSVAIQAGRNQQVDVWLVPIESGYSTIAPEDYFLPDSISEQKQLPDTTVAPEVNTDSSKVDGRFLSKAFVSSRQKIQSLNIGEYFASRPFQFSVTPGLGTHGKMSGQVVNNFSMNLLGGYSGGLEGFELGGLFNINKRDAGYLQMAGLFNLTGGKQRGLQIGGISNTVLDTAQGFMLGGVTNFTKHSMHGLQIGGVYNHAGGEVRGMQVAGVANYSRKKMNGVQIAGVTNYADKANGVQISGVVNYTNHLKGVQIGLINIADTSDGYSIGLLNFVRRGYHKIFIGSNETMDLQVALKSGNRKLYSILLAAANTDTNNRLYSFGYGLGSEWIGTRYFSLSTDATAQYLYQGSWDYLNLLTKFSLNLHLNITRGFSLFGGPSFNFYYSDQPGKMPGYQYEVPRSGYAPFTADGNWRGWGGWHAGISIF